MNSSLFVARRIIKNAPKGVSSVIFKIAAVTIALGVAVMICANSVINGFQNEISDKIFGFWGHIHLNDTKITRSFESIPIRSNPAMIDSIYNIYQEDYIDRETGETKTTLGGVTHIQSYTFMPGILNREKVFEGILLKGIGPDCDESRLKSFLAEGELINFNPDEESRDLIISEITAQRMEVTVGQKMIINFVQDRNVVKKAFTITGIYKTGLGEYDKRFAYCDQRVLQDVMDWDANQISGYEIFLDHIDDAEGMADIIYADYLPRGMFAETIHEKRPNIFEWLKLLNVNEQIIIMLMIIVSIINMVTVILIFILDRGHMIGVLKSVGFPDWDIRKIFIYQAFWLVVKGVVLGNIIAITLLVAQRYFGFIRLDESSYYLAVAPVSFSLWQIMLINLLAVFVISVWMIIPTYIITRIKPIKVLEFG